MKSITIDALPQTIEEIDGGWKTWTNIRMDALRFAPGKIVEINGEPQKVTQKSIATFLSQVRAGDYRGGVGQVSKYLYDNMNSPTGLASLNAIVESPLNKMAHVNVRSHKDEILGFDKPNRYYATARELIIPFVARTYEAAAKFGSEARVNEMMISPTEGIRASFILKEFKSAEEYGFGVQLTHQFVGKEKTVMSPIIKQGFCDNTIRSAFDMGLLNINGMMIRFNMMVSTVGGMVDSMREETLKFEGLKQISMNQEQFVNVLGNNRISLTDEQHIAMLEGTRNDTTTAYGWINGLTFAAHKVEMPDSQKVQMEMFAGKLIATPEKFGLKRYVN